MESGKPNGGLFGLARSRTFSFELIFAFLSLLVITVMFVVWYTYYSNSRTILSLSGDLINHVNEAVVQKTTSYLSPAATMTQFAAHVRGNQIDRITQSPDLERDMLEVLKLYPQLANSTVGNERGDFLMLKRLPDGAMATKTIDARTQPPVVTWRYTDANGALTSSKQEAFDGYDPRQRPWYVGAKVARGSFWSDTYIFHSDQSPGITAAYPVLDKQGVVAGVFGLDIQLEEVSHFLKSLKIGDTGLAFIINRGGATVAYPDAGRAAVAEGSGFRLRQIQETGNEAVVASYSNFQSNKRPSFNFDLKGERYIASYRPFPASFQKAWTIGLVVPEDDFVGAIKQTNHISLLISLIILAIASCFALILSRKISRPIVELTKEMDKVRNLELEDPVDIHSPIREIQLMADALQRMKLGLFAFRRYVPATLVRQLLQRDSQCRIGGEERDLSILFTDIEKFSTICEQMPPQDLMLHLSQYFEEVTQCLQEQHGTIDKYIGDSIMAFWGAPHANAQHATLACCAALRVRRKVDKLNAEWSKNGQHCFRTRIGLHSAKVIVGNVGSSERMNYTVLGDGVNLASRLEAVNKLYGTDIMVSQETRDQAGDRFLFRAIDSVAVQGKTQHTRIYELVGDMEDADPPSDTDRHFCLQFEEALAHYTQRRWDQALAAFTVLHQQRPTDPVASIYMTRCRELLDSPPEGDWDSTQHLKKI